MSFPLEGGCHCRWCQRESGASFALNAMIETDRLSVTGKVEIVDTPSQSGTGQKIARCRWTIPTHWRPTSTSSPPRSSLGW